MVCDLVRMSSRPQAALLLASCLSLSLGCAEKCTREPGSDEGGARAAPPVPAPLVFEGTAYDRAGATRLPARKAEEFPGLHHVYRLSPDMISGSEPDGEEAFRHLAAMGVKTIVSVDGKTPDAATAGKYGIRYVHLPIQYKGITPDETLRLAKTYRELEGPIYTHCFHGQHRGPAAAAIGRIVRDGASRDTAIAEMRQYCETSKKYEGLYLAIAKGEIPSASATAAYRWDFPSAQPFRGFRRGMVDVSRCFDPLQQMVKGGFRPLAEHPDLDPANESAKLAELFAAIEASDEAKRRPEDFRAWLSQSVQDSAQLRDLLGRAREGEAPAVADATEALRKVEATCNACHAVYRN